MYSQTIKHNERLLQQLLTQDHKNSLDDLFCLAQTAEAAEKESFRRADDNSTANSVAMMKLSKNKLVVSGFLNSFRSTRFLREQ